jgi:aconitate hydratase
LTSPALAAALALSGDAGFDPQADPLTGTDGNEFKLDPPNPPALPEGGLVSEKSAFVAPLDDAEKIQVRIDPDSERLELLKPFEPWNGKDFLDLPILVKTKGKTTTDHISPGGKWLRFRGHLTNISRNMLEGAMNAFTGESGHGTDVLTGQKGLRFSELAKIYRDKTGGFVIIGDENYGEGSSREHAAMSPRFMGARAVVVRSFARIHEVNLKKQGILPLIFVDPEDYEKIGEYDRISLLKLADLAPGKQVKMVVTPQDGSPYELSLKHTLTEEQIDWFKAGSALNTLNEDR